MPEETNKKQTTTYRLNKLTKEFGVTVQRIVDYLSKKGFEIKNSPNEKLNEEMYQLVSKEFSKDKELKKNAEKLSDLTYKGGTASIENVKTDDAHETEYVPDIIVRTNILSNALKKETAREDNTHVEKLANETDNDVIEAKNEKTDAKEQNIEETTVDVAAIKQKTDSEDSHTESEKEQKITSEKVEESSKEVADKEKEEPFGLKIIDKIDLPSNSKKKKEDKVNKEKEKKHQPNNTEQNQQPQANKHKQTVQSQNQEKVESADDKSQGIKQPRVIETVYQKLDGPKVLDKIELPDLRDRKRNKASKQEPVASSSDSAKDINKKRKRQRIGVNDQQQLGKKNSNQSDGNKQKNNKPDGTKQKPSKKDRFKREPIVEPSEEDVKKQIKETLERLTAPGKSKASKHNREKRNKVAEQQRSEAARQEEENKILKVTEFVTANDLATMMNVPVVKVIATFMSLGKPVSINQRLDAEYLSLVAEEFGFKVDFVSAELQEAIAEKEEADNEKDMLPRPPVVTVMGHVDHGKTKLLDYIRNTNVVAGEAGGITQHIGAYEVTTSTGKKMTFLDTPGHEAFTAMRARGAKMTDVVIIVIATDDNVMPQTVEAINHAQAAGVPIVFALNKIDKPTANPDKIREQLANMNILVEEWGGKFQSQEISAKAGIGVEELLEKVMLEAEMLELKANPNRLAKGTVIESALDKGRGYVAKILVQSGTLRIGDMMLAGTTYGKVKAMFDDHNRNIKEAGPSTPVLLLGLNGAPEAGDTFNIMTDEREVKSIASRRQQLQRELIRRATPHITLEEIGRRIAKGDFKELNLIVKADVDGSVEALSDSLLKLSTDEVQVNVIHKSVGAISESDVNLAVASNNAIIIGFNVRPTTQAKRLADQTKIDIRIYSIIYTAIEEIKLAIEGMLTPDIKEVVTCNIEIRETFNISKVGTIAGCMVLDGKVTRNTKIRVIRDGIVIHTGILGSLKRYKDDVKEVPAGMECGLNIDRFNDIKVGDIIEGYTEEEVARKLL